MTDYTPPERMFVSFDGENIFGDTLPYASFNRESDHDTEYIRADLVEAAKRQGAIEALEKALDITHHSGGGIGWYVHAKTLKKQLAALKADSSNPKE